MTGGLVFGYDNVPIVDARGKQSHVERRINESQAAIVREIFDRYASGWGYARIAKALNAVHASSPRPTEHKPAGWSPSSVRCILRRDLYRGVVMWNWSQKRDKWERQRQQARPETEWMTLPVNESLRIVSDVRGRGARAVCPHADDGVDDAGTPIRTTPSLGASRTRNSPVCFVLTRLDSSTMYSCPRPECETARPSGAQRSSRRSRLFRAGDVSAKPWTLYPSRCAAILISRKAVVLPEPATR